MAKKQSEISRTATFAWSPGQQAPLIATGTAAGALDDSFSNASVLELFKLDLTHTGGQATEPVGKISSNARFNKIAWGAVSTHNPYGIIAGGLEDGSLSLWNPNHILDGKSQEESLIMNNTTHTGQIRGLDFNRFQSNLLASAGSNNEIYIWDLTKPDTPYSPGAKSSKLEDITSVGWNGQVQHILATSSSTGHTVVWDLRNRREVMTLSAPISGGINTGHRSISSVVWHPDNTTQLVTASEDDSNPVVTLWDLRHAQSPEKVLSGHTKGVLGLSWCRQDSDLLMSCGKDCKTLIWNPNSGEMLGELAQNTNWTFQTEWCPRNPDLLASASFDGKINVYSLQPSDNQEETATPVVSDDPFAAAMNASAATSSAFALRHPPKWLRRPVGGTFGFGGKLVTFNNKAGQAAAQAAANAPPGQAPAPQSVPRAIHITSVVTDPETAQRADELEKAVQEENMDQWIDQRIEQAKANKDDKESWEVIKTLLAADAREQLMNYLGFEKQQVMDAVAKITADKQTVSITPTEEPVVEEEKPAVEEEESAEKPAEDAVVEDAATQEAGKEVSGLFQGEEGGDDFFIQSDNTQTPAAQEMDALVSAIKKEPLQLYAEGSSEEDRLITRAVILGDFESAVNLCLATDRLSDALLFAICGGGDLLARTQAAYFKLKSNSYLRLLESVVQDDLESVVASVSLDEWTSVIVVLCTFAKAEEFGPLCEALAARLEEGWSRADTEGAKDYRRHATLCYLAAGNMEKVTRIWIAEQQEEVEESKGDDAVYAASLQHLMEKVTVFRKVIGFQDDAIAADPNETTFALSSLYDKYIEYSELLAAQGKLASALRYLNLTPVGYKKSTNDKSYLVRDRVYHACPSSVSNQVAAPAALYGGDLIQSTAEVQYQQQQQQQPVSTSYQPVTTGIQQQQQQSRSAYAPISSPLTTHQYAAPATNAYTPVSNAYAPTYTPTTTNSYAPTTNTNTYTPTTTYTPAATQPYTPNTATGPATNAYQPQAVSTPPSTQMYNNTSGYNQYNSGGYNYGNDQYTNSAYTPGRTSIPQPPPIIGSNPTASPHQSPSAPPPPPKKVEGAWNDPPMAIAASKKVKSPKPSAPTKRVMSPFPNQPAQSSFVPQQQQPGFPPPPQGPPMMGQGPPQGPPMMGPPRPPMGAPPMGAPPMMGPPRGQTPPARQPLPPPPMNAAPPMAMAKQRPPPPPMGGYYQAGQRN